MERKSLYKPFRHAPFMGIMFEDGPLGMGMKHKGITSNERKINL